MKATMLLLLPCVCVLIGFGQDSIPHQHGNILEIKGHWFTTQAQDFFGSIKINPEMLSQQRGGQLSQSLTFLPGMSAISTGVGVAKPVIRGFSGARVAVMDMGIRQEGQQWGNDHGLEWDQYSVGQLTIIKGASNLEYGGDALGGVMVIEHEPWSKVKSSSQVLGVVSNNNKQRGWSIFHQHSFQNSDKFKSRFGVRWTHLATDDYKVPASSFTYLNRTLPLKNGLLNNTATQEQHLTVFNEWRFSAQSLQSIGITYRMNNTHSGLFPGFVGIPTVQSVSGDGNLSNLSLPSVHNVHQKLLLALQFRAGKEAIKFNVGFQHSNREELSKPHQPGYVPMNADSLSLGLGLMTVQWNMSKDWTWNDRWRLKSGLQFQVKRNEVLGHEFLIPNYLQKQQACFVVLTNESTRRFRSFFGLRVEEARVSVKGYSQPWYAVNLPTDSTMIRVSPFQKDNVGWSGQFGFRWNGPKDWQANTVWGKVYRVPQINELAINGIHHGSHRHERGSSALRWESGYQWDVNVMKEAKNGHLQLTGFVAFYDNYIFLAPQAYFSDLPDGGQVYQYRQSAVLWSGGEWFVDWHPCSWWKVDGAIEGIYTQEVKTGLGLPFIPPVTIKSNQQWNWVSQQGVHEWTFLLNARYALDQNRVSRNERPTPGYFVLNANLQYQREWEKGRSISLTLQCNNVNNAVYSNHLSLYRPMNLAEQGRCFQFTSVINF